MTHAYRITTSTRSVVVTFATGRTREYWCPSGGGYVREITESRPGTLGLQVAADLSHAGDMLSVGSPAELPAAIRAGLRRAVAAGRKIDAGGDPFARRRTPAEALEVVGLA
jgi:hypothetical protein